MTLFRTLCVFPNIVQFQGYDTYMYYEAWCYDIQVSSSFATTSGVPLTDTTVFWKCIIYGKIPTAKQRNSLLKQPHTVSGQQDLKIVFFLKLLG